MAAGKAVASQGLKLAGQTLLVAGVLSLLVPLAARETGAQTAAAGPSCADSLQARIDAANPGDTVELEKDCVYREMITVDKPLTLDGGGGGEIRGSDVWDGWRKDGPAWISSKVVPDFAVSSRYLCEGDSQRCQRPEQVFFDGTPLTQVASEPQPGEFALDGDRRVVLAQVPAGRTVEVTVRRSWVVGASDGVTVRGITMKHATENGLWNGGYPDWTVENNNLSHAHARNLTLTLADSLVARNNDLHHGGQMGLGSHDAGVEIVGNRVYANNTEDFRTGWEAGGMKITRARTALVAENEVYDNEAIGIWTDIANPDQGPVEIARNRVHDQPRAGIRVEITKNFSVHDNVLWENGWGEGDSYSGVGISVNGSRDGTVDDNILAWNASGIGVVQQDRAGPEEQSYDTTSNVTLRSNRIVQDEVPGSSGHAAIFWNGDRNAVSAGAPSLYDPRMGNGGQNNGYWFDEPQGNTYRFKWENGLHTLDDFNATPAERGGRYLPDSERDALLEEHALPAAPGDHPRGATGLLSRAGNVVTWLWNML